MFVVSEVFGVEGPASTWCRSCRHLPFRGWVGVWPVVWEGVWGCSRKCGNTTVGLSAHCWVLRGRPEVSGGVFWAVCSRLPAGRWWSGRVRVVVENCTVDASIFCFCDFAFFLVMLAGVLVKLSRAHGGCLGIRSR